MHIHGCMGSKTISLEDSAYSKLKAAKRSGESFSDVIHRLLGEGEPSLMEFTRLADRQVVEKIAEAVLRMREEDIELQKRKVKEGRA